MTPPKPASRAGPASVANAPMDERAGGAAGAWGMGAQTPACPRDDDTAAKDWERLGTKSAVVGGPVPPAPVASPARHARDSVRGQGGPGVLLLLHHDGRAKECLGRA